MTRVSLFAKGPESDFYAPAPVGKAAL